jgi:ATP-dependent helicase/nuclease subunit B
LDELPRFDTLSAHATVWTRLADRVGIFRSMRSETAAWKQLQETLQEGQQLAAWLGQDVPRLDRKQAREALVDILGNQTLGTANEEPGRVRVLAAASVRHLRIPYLFLAGLSEKSFPAADPGDGVYSEAEHQRLIEAGLPLPSRSDRQSDEMLLFYETISAATRRLYLSYPAIDERGEPLTPSPYLKEVEQACGTTPVARFEQIDLSPVPGQGEVCSLDAFRVRAVADALQGKAEPLAGLVKEEGEKGRRGEREKGRKGEGECSGDARR